MSEPNTEKKDGETAAATALPSYTVDPEQVRALLEKARTISGAYTPPRKPRRELRAPTRLLLVAIGLGGMTDALIYGQRPGVGYAIFTILLLIALVGLAWNEGVPVRKRPALVLGLPLLFFSGMVAVRANDFIVFLDICTSLYLMGLLAHFYTGGSLSTMGISGFIGVPLLTLGNTLGQASPVVRTAIARNRSGDSERRRQILAVMKGLLLAIPVLMVFLPFLLSADAVFAHEANRFVSWLLPENWTEGVWRALLIAGAAWLIAGGLVHTLTRMESAGDAATPTAKRPLGFIEGMTPLTLVCALFGAFVAVQFAYLFGGAARVQTVPGLTYAAYAHQGFAELVTVAVLTLFVATLWQRILHREGRGQELGFQGIITLLVGLTLVMLASAFQRMAAYEAAYGATEMRLYVDAFIFCLGAVLIWFVASLWMGQHRRFASGMFLCIMGYIAWLNLQNADAIVVRTNIERALAGKQRLDYEMLPYLSDDAIPTLRDALDQGRLSPQSRQLILAALRKREERCKTERQQMGWPSWNASREAAYRALTAHTAGL